MRTRSEDEERDLDACLARAVLCRALRQALASGAAPIDGDAVVAAAATLDREGDLEAVALALDAQRDDPSREAAHSRLFGPTLRGRVCAYETEYGPSGPFQQAQALADIAGYYRAFGLTTGSGSEARPDHIGCELEFAGFLALKEAWALERGDDGMLEVTRTASSRFLREHLGRFGRAFARSLAREAPDGFFGAAARLCESLIAAMCEQAGVPVGPELLELREEHEDAAPMACASCSLSDLNGG